MNVIKHTKNIHEIKIKGMTSKIAMLSDIHWDNPKCDRELLKKDLDYCVSENIPIMINGDLFCLMQGKGDRRGNKSDILPEHNNARYLDSVVETAIEWWAPYAHLLTVIGYGNHCTNIIKWQETDVLQRFVDLLNYKCKTNIYTGGYGGWLIITNDMTSTTSVSIKVKYYHGSGGGGVVTKGALNLTRALEMYEGFDVFAMGHIHENSCRNDVRDTIVCHKKSGFNHKLKDIHLMITGTYKEEYEDGSKGWHVERGAPPKPCGGRILIVDNKRMYSQENIIAKSIDSTKFPI